MSESKRKRKTSKKEFANEEIPPEVQKLLNKIDANEYTQSTIFDFLDEEVVPMIHEENEYKLLHEGAVVRNIYNKKDYKVVKPSNTNMVEVFDTEHGYLTMARSDIEVMVDLGGFG